MLQNHFRRRNVASTPQQCGMLAWTPRNVISDRGPQFVSHFWQRLLQTLGIFVKLFFTYHPHIDGQTERVNQILEQYLRCSVNYQQDYWVNLLSLAEFAYNKLFSPCIDWRHFLLCKLWFTSSSQHFPPYHFREPFNEGSSPCFRRATS